MHKSTGYKKRREWMSEVKLKEGVWFMRAWKKGNTVAVKNLEAPFFVVDPISDKYLI